MNPSSSFTRRSFITRLGSAGAGALVAPNIISSRAWADSPSQKLNIAIIGYGSRASGAIVPEALRAGANLIAICDVDAGRIPGSNKEVLKHYAEAESMLQKATVYSDYRKLIESEKSLDAVLIATGNRWHVPLCKAFMQAGKHVYCEKPLAIRVSEARDLGDFARQSKVATQMGTQGTASQDFRKAIEIIQSGILGHIREGHCWDAGGPRSLSKSRPEGEDPIPQGLNWDMWLGPAAYRPFKQGAYLGLSNWWPWLDLGAGKVTEFGTHTFQLPIRALKLGYPDRVEHELAEPLKDTYLSRGKIRYDFPARGELAPVSLTWYDGGNFPPLEATRDIEATYGKVPQPGCILIGEKGTLFAGGWGSGNLMKLKGEPKMRSVLDHAAAKDIPMTEPRLAKGENHMTEWLNAAKGGPKTYSPLEVGAHSMEILLPGIVALRMGGKIDWDGANMKVKGAPDAEQFIKANYRQKWL